MWKEAALALFDAQYHHLPGGARDNHENLSQDSRSPGRNLNPGSPGYETGVLPTRSQRLVISKMKHALYREYFPIVLSFYSLGT
jgi:hypothetical protein